MYGSNWVKGQIYVVFLFVHPRSLGRSSPNLEGKWRAAPDISLRGSFFERSRSSRSKVKFVIFFSFPLCMSYLRLCVCVCMCVCLICLHRRNHLTATSRRVKFTSKLNMWTDGRQTDTGTCLSNKLTSEPSAQAS